MSKNDYKEMSRISGLITLYLSGELSEEKNKELEVWLAESEEHRRLFERICAKQTMCDKIRQYRNEEVGNAFQDFLYRRKRLCVRRRIYRWSACAVLVLLLGGGLLQWWLTAGEPFRNKQFAQEIILTDSSERRPVLVLANGERVVIPEKNLTFEETEQGQRVISGNELLLQSGDTVAGNETAYNTMEVPPMCDFHCILSDGTKVWMNASSSLRYPVKFAAGARTVYVTGEVYLEVAKDPERPFYVELDGMEIAVLGTCFNVRAYPREQQTRITLAEGKIAAQIGEKNYTLTPGHQLCLEEKSGSVNIHSVDVDDVLAWKRGFYVFKKSRLADVASTLQCWYNVEIMMTSDVSTTTTYTGVVNKEEPIEVFMQRLEEVSAVKCERRNNTIVIY